MLNVQNGSDQRKPIHMACRWGHTVTIKFILDYALEHEVNLGMNIVDNDGLTPLHWSCYKGIVANVHLLLSYHWKTKSIDLIAPDPYGRTPLHLACEAPLNDSSDRSSSSRDYHEIVKSLFNFSRGNKREIGLNIKDKAGRTPLDTARHSGEMDSVRIITGSAPSWPPPPSWPPSWW